MEIILLSVFGGVLVYSALTLALVYSPKAIMRKRLAEYFKKADIDEIEVEVLKEKRRKKKSKEQRRFQFVSREIASYLTMSGVRLRPAEFVAGWALSATLPALIAFFISESLVTALGIGIIGLSIPPVLVQRSRKKRESEFSKQLGESLSVMGNCIKAGFSFQQAMESIAREMPPPISTEFDMALREMHYGISMEESLKHLVDRVNNKDLDLLVSAVLISAQVGGNLSDIIEVISDTVSDRLKIKSEVRVLTTSGRFSGIIIGLLPVLIILVLMVLNPRYFNSFAESNIGRAMLTVSVILEAVGFLAIRKIVDIKY
jgi:tight adherence protein B